MFPAEKSISFSNHIFTRYYTILIVNEGYECNVMDAWGCFVLPAKTLTQSLFGKY